jgi:hypothetical protein
VARGFKGTVGGDDVLSTYSRSIPDIFADAANQVSFLVRKDQFSGPQGRALARAEMSEKITDLAVGLGLLVAGSVLMIPALVILRHAAPSTRRRDGEISPKERPWNERARSLSKKRPTPVRS